jgi:hypothetical protein
LLRPSSTVIGGPPSDLRSDACGRRRTAIESLVGNTTDAMQKYDALGVQFAITNSGGLGA